MTLPMQVADPSHLLDLIGHNCAQDQEYRELTENSRQAIERVQAIDPTFKGKIVWDIDWPLAAKGIFKLSITDNGCGMSANEAALFINNLASSGSELGVGKNYGIGAKVAGLRANPAGLVYRTLRKGDPAVMLHMHRENGVYGMRDIEVEDGLVHLLEYDANDPSVPEDELPKMILEAGHGTKVSLWGVTDEGQTLRTPGRDSMWGIQRYLNERYFKIPDNIEIKVRVMENTDQGQWPKSEAECGSKGRLRSVEGMAYHLERNSECSGSVRLGDATARWWVLREKGGASYWRNFGHRGVLYQNEIYNYSKLPKHLGAFGINRKAAKRVVIYIEPDDKLRVSANDSRSRVTLPGDAEVPWEKWAIAFMRRPPDALTEFCKQFEEDSEVSDDVSKRMVQNRNLYDLMAYRPAKRGRVTLSGGTNGKGTHGVQDEGMEDIFIGNDPLPTGGGGGSNGPSPGPSDGNKPRPVIRRAKGSVAKGGKKQKVEPELDIPKVDWVSIEAGSREPGDDLEDRAAMYIPESHKLDINADFRLFKTIQTRLEAEFNPGFVPAVTEIIVRHMRSVYQLTLCEVIVGARSLERSREWNRSHMESAWSPESLTQAVQPRDLIYREITRLLRRDKVRLQTATIHHHTDESAPASAPA